ncbi:hypothetical protein HBI56_221580 [Parastagonospora nodorum]|uniref:Uncharacterized protein n=1 Tax=Phaeosphaeria nodorum (strain SN15 / ATCC MYA-4574 / FGSC 10173) TaxID=321614 RepID=A0A7U2ID98_PHANO|nr:hypothetical protein HBH56_232450 [Parastagonospora nodorum]QRD07732.1 hypothetical protein JI435_448140 [Parastagonospora nodorum SN15]KAH3921418.1 hypothetical protein HBH54_240620 [Parastagonospora nodorum]KAH4013476.1 hypothetical protein HBI09_215360 [Parastagonospora nodorum]KAH4125382.1 hypothetical protein HBH45_231730 [Parastagonospora nodorum]
MSKNQSRKQCCSTSYYYWTKAKEATTPLIKAGDKYSCLRLPHQTSPSVPCGSSPLPYYAAHPLCPASTKPNSTSLLNQIAALLDAPSQRRRRQGTRDIQRLARLKNVKERCVGSSDGSSYAVSWTLDVDAVVLQQNIHLLFDSTGTGVNPCMTPQYAIAQLPS